MPIPKYGWPELRFLYLYNVPSLYHAPGPRDCPKLQLAHFTYAYHCCAFESFLPSDWNNVSSVFEMPAGIPLPSHINDLEEVTAPPGIPNDRNLTYICNFYKLLYNITDFCLSDEEAKPSVEPTQIYLTEIEIIHRHLAITNTSLNNSLVCYPRADPMTPCEHLFGSWVLRVLVWVVFVVILFGNGLVLTMILLRILASLKPFHRSGLSFTNSKVSQFYISQLAVADIGICIYLGFLIVVDSKTLNKQEFYQMALSWQYGPGCLIAGFIAILSSELSVYILVLIVLERIYVFKCTVTATKTQMCNTILIILFGWLFAGACAILPLIGINSYTTVAICLPLDVISTKGRLYIAILMGINLLAFLFMIICNFYLCYRLRKMISDYKMLRVMLVLIITDFICWAPLIAFGFAALSKHAIVNTSIAKWFIVLVLPFTACVNPFLYGPLTEKFKYQMQKICHNAKRILPQNCFTSQQQCDRNPIILNEFQNLPGSMPSIVSSSSPLPDHHASLPELGSNESYIGSQKSIPLSNSLPELAISSETESIQDTVKAQATGSANKQIKIKDDVDTKEWKMKKYSSKINPDKVSSKINHTIKGHSGIDNPTINAKTFQGIDEDLQSITSLSDDVNSSVNNDHHTINVLSSKLNSSATIEETDV